MQELGGNATLLFYQSEEGDEVSMCVYVCERESVCVCTCVHTCAKRLRIGWKKSAVCSGNFRTTGHSCLPKHVCKKYIPLVGLPDLGGRLTKVACSSNCAATKANTGS